MAETDFRLVSTIQKPIIEYLKFKSPGLIVETAVECPSKWSLWIRLFDLERSADNEFHVPAGPNSLDRDSLRVGVFSPYDFANNPLFFPLK